jgi:hypothetical protein
VVTQYQVQQHVCGVKRTLHSLTVRPIKFINSKRTIQQNHCDIWLQNNKQIIHTTNIIDGYGISSFADRRYQMPCDTKRGIPAVRNYPTAIFISREPKDLQFTARKLSSLEGRI